MRKKLLQNILFAAMAAWAMYGTGMTVPLGFEHTEVSTASASAAPWR